MSIPLSYDEFDTWLYNTSCTAQKRNHAAFKSRRGWTVEERGLHHYISAEEWLAASIKGYYPSDGSVRVELRGGENHVLLKDAINLMTADYERYVAETTAIVAGQKALKVK